MQRFVIVLSLGAFTLGVTPITASAVVAPALAPAITATPDTGLFQEDQVTVGGSGFVANGIAVVEFCPDHNPTCRYAATTNVDSTGAFSVDVAAEFHTLDASGAPSDCNTEGCFVRASEVDGTATQSATTPIAFDPTQASLPPQTLTVVPTDALHDHDTVHASGNGFEPSDVQQCALSEGVCRFVGVEPTFAPDGSFTADLEVRRFITRPNRDPVDCTTTPCVILAESLGTPIANLTAPVTFDPTAPFSPLPTMSVTPNANLQLESVATIDGHNFLPGETVRAQECKFDSVFGPCRDISASTLSTDPTGSITFAATLHRLIPDQFGTPTSTNCADPTITCGVQVHGMTSGDIVSTTITFDPGLALPSMTVDPATDLPFRGFVAVHGHHLLANTAYSSAECAGAGSTRPVACAPSARGTSNGAGDLDLLVPIRRRLTTYTASVDGYALTRYDCTDAQVTCRVGLAPATGGDSLHADITFDPLAPIPPPRTISVVPALDLGARQLVTVTGSGFLPDSPVALTECDSGPARFGIAFCVGSDQTRSDAAGNITTTAIVRKLLSQGFGTPTDCSLTVGACVLRVGTPGIAADPTESTDAPLGFDPDSGPTPHPPVTVSPTTGLVDGQTVNVEGSGFTADSLIGIAMCRAGTTFSLLDCEITNPVWFPDDASGAFSHAYNVRTHITTGHGAVDCTVAARTCSLVVVNAGDYSEFSPTPVTFGTRPPPHHRHHHHHKHHHRHHHHG